MAKKNLSPFTPEEADAFRAMLYGVNSAHSCCNPPHISWIRGFQYDEADRIGRKGLYAEYGEQKECNCVNIIE